MSAKLTGQLSLLDLSAFEAAAIYNGEETAKGQIKLKRRTDFIAKKLIEDDAEPVFSLQDSACIASRMNRLLEVLPGGVVVLDGRGVVQQCNAAANELLNVQLEGMSWVAIIEHAFIPSSDSGLDVSLKDGRLVHISTSPLEDEPGQIILLQDVSETRKLQQKVSHLERLSALGEMAARLAHQIRTPLSSALLYLSPLLKEDADPKVKTRFAKRLHKSITHMEHLVKDMLAFSRGDMAETEPVILDKLLITIQQQFLSNPDTASYKLFIENTVSDGYVYGSKDALCSAVNNLLNNARLASKEGEEITIFADNVTNEHGDTCIEISVQDNGCGISEEDQANVLEPFFTTRSSGTGLGLAVVKSIVKAHKGELWFESIEGEGSTFVIRLPMYQPADKFTLTAQ